MIRILIAEDEPASGDYLAAIIMRNLTNAVLMDTAEDGQDALEKIEIMTPDILLADITMPRMNGLRLIEVVRKRWPLVQCVIVSGYQEFEYARQAMHFGVQKYLLKPVLPQELIDCLTQLSLQIESDRHVRGVGLLNLLMRGLSPQQKMMDEVFGCKGYHAVLARSFGLPSFTPFPFEVDTSQSDPNSCQYVLSGRDVRERLAVWPWTDGVNMVPDFMPVEDGVTVVISASPLSLENLPVVTETLCKIMDQRLCAVPVRVNDEEPLPLLCTPDETLSLVEYLDQAKAYRLPLLTLNRHLHNRFIALASRNGQRSVRDIVEALREAFQSAENYDRLCEQLMMLHRECVQAPGRHERDIGTLDALLRYIDAHQAEPQTLYDVSRACGLSQTSINRLFRHHTQTNFVGYLTERRIETAKRILRETPDARIKDVAETVGYSDPLYFSRVFRAHTGLPPTKYAEQFLV